MECNYQCDLCPDAEWCYAELNALVEELSLPQNEGLRNVMIQENKQPLEKVKESENGR